MTVRARTVARTAALLAGLIGVALSPGVAAGATEPWPAIPPAELAQVSARVDAGAGAEVLLWSRRVKDVQGVFGGYRTVVSQHLRTRVFAESAVKDQASLVIPFGEDMKVEDVSGRTVQPDGTTVAVDPAAIFRQSLARKGDVHVQAVRIAFPAVRAGSVVEVRWTETYDDHVTSYEAVELQRELPVQRLVYSIKPLHGSSFGMRSRPFRVSPPPFRKDPDGFYTTELVNLAAFREEPYSPPLSTTRAWMLVYYTGEDEDEPDAFWKRIGRRIHANLEEQLEPNRAARTLAAETVGAEPQPEARLRRLFDLSRSRVRDSTAPGVSEKERKGSEPLLRGTKILDRGYGAPHEIGVVFAMLARAAGFDARIAYYTNRSRFLFHPSLANAYFLTSSCVAVKVGDSWRFFDPGNRFLPWGLLRWSAENALALVPDAETPAFERIPTSDAGSNGERTRTRLRLAEDGSAEGEVRVELRGQRAVDERAELEGLSVDGRLERIRKQLGEALPGAEVSGYDVQAPAPPADPVVWTAKVSIPSFGKRVGSRLLVAPSVLRKGRATDLPDTERKQPIFLRYAFSEEDEVTIELPPGWGPEEPPLPAHVTRSVFGEADVSVVSSSDPPAVVLRRTARFEGGFHPPSRYAELRAFFGALREVDDRQVPLRRAEGK